MSLECMLGIVENFLASRGEIVLSVFEHRSRDVDAKLCFNF